MIAVRKDLKAVKSFIGQIRVHIEKLRIYSKWDPYVWDNYVKELWNFRTQPSNILKDLNDHSSVLELRSELEDVMAEFERVYEECKNNRNFF